jgi:hypothetical protein
MAPEGTQISRSMSRPEAHRTISQALRIAREREEQETLLGDEENIAPDSTLTRAHSYHENPHADLPVYKTIHRYAEHPAIPEVTH